LLVSKTFTSPFECWRGFCVWCEPFETNHSAGNGAIDLLSVAYPLRNLGKTHLFYEVTQLFF